MCHTESGLKSLTVGSHLTRSSRWPRRASRLHVGGGGSERRLTDGPCQVSSDWPTPPPERWDPCFAAHFRQMSHDLAVWARRVVTRDDVGPSKRVFLNRPFWQSNISSEYHSLMLWAFCIWPFLQSYYHHYMAANLTRFWVLKQQ